LEKRGLIEKKEKTLSLNRSGRTEVELLLIKLQDEFKKQFNVLTSLEMEILYKLINKLGSLLNKGGSRV